MSRLPSIDPRDLRDPADDARVERIWSRVREGLPVPATVVSARKPTFARTAFMFAAAAGMFGAGIAIGKMGEPEAEPSSVHATADSSMTDVFAAGSRPRSFALPGGGRITVEPGSMVEVVSISDVLVNLSLLRGAASVDAVSIPIDVVAGEAIVTAPAGASVSLARRESDLDVLVAQGSAYVSSPAGQQVVKGGHVLSRVPIVATLTSNEGPDPIAPPVPVEIADRDPHHATPSPTGSAIDPSTSADPAPTSTATVAALPDAPATWLTLAQGNKHKEALALMEKGAGLEATIQSAQSARELMYLWELAAAANKANLQVRALRRVADEFGSDPSAYVAAMQLAQLYDSTDKSLAAKYREKAAQTKSLAEVALCAQVRAMVEEGEDVDPRRATLKASEYLQSYPMGSCAGDAKSLLEEVAGRSTGPQGPPYPSGSGSSAPNDSKSGATSSSASSAPPPGAPSTSPSDKSIPNGKGPTATPSAGDRAPTDAPAAPPSDAP